MKRALEILDHEIVLRVNALNRALGREAVLLASGWARGLLKVVQELVEEIDREVGRRGCMNCDDQCMTSFVSCAKGRYSEFDRYAGNPQDDH